MEYNMQRQTGGVNSLVTSQQGIALMMVLWILVFLTVIVLSFSATVRTDAYSALSFKKEVENKFLAEAGIQRGLMEIFYRNFNKNQKVIIEGREVLPVDGRVYQSPIGDGFYTFCIMDESGKININALSDNTRVIMYNLLVNRGIPGQEADALVDSILDWKDADDLHRLNGAENDYYLSLPDPYQAKNASFDTLEELLLVKGMTPQILFGDDGKSGIAPMLTVHSATNKINVKTAPREVLIAIPGMTADLADSIIALRESKPEEFVQQLQALFDKSYDTMMPYIGAGDSNIYTIDAVGYREDKRKGYTIRATFIMESADKYRTIFYKSPA